eukprot:jgi/Picsp_1/4014/NSC_01526-R1_protein
MSHRLAGFSDLLVDAGAYVENNKATVVIAGGVTILAGLGLYMQRCKGSSSKPGTFDIGSGSVDRSKVRDEVKDYYDEFNTLERGKGAVLNKKEKVAQLVDKFYSLVTDLYEWGWGTSFHFSPLLPGKDWAACESAHEGRIAALIGLEPGKVALDVGCGVGGPMRTIAATSQGKVTGITINQYQLEEVYGEVFRTLKPGSVFVAYEWVTTPNYDDKNENHVAIADEIIIGNGLPNLRTWKQAEEAGKTVGFKLLKSRDLAVKADGSLTPWWHRLSSSLNVFKWKAKFNHSLVTVAEYIGVAPKGMIQVHQMLVDTGIALIEGGEQGLFTPMHMLVFQKP